MLIYSSEPIRDLNNRLRIPTTSHYLDEYDIYEEVWLPVGDDVRPKKLNGMDEPFPGV